MDMILLIAVVLFISMVGAGLFRLAAERVAEVQGESEPTDPAETAVVEAGEKVPAEQTAAEKKPLPPLRRSLVNQNCLGG